MVWLNSDHINRTSPGHFGGAMCTCGVCAFERSQKEKSVIRKDSVALMRDALEAFVDVFRDGIEKAGNTRELDVLTDAINAIKKHKGKE